MHIKCPKCGEIQKQSDVCVKCKVSIAKFLHDMELAERGEALGAHPGEAPQTFGAAHPAVATSAAAEEEEVPAKSRPILNSLIIIILLSLVAIPIVYYYSQKPDLYLNKRYGFTLEIPKEWPNYTSTATLPRSESPVSLKDYMLITGPGSVLGPMLYVQTWPSSTDKLMWDGLVRHKKARTIVLSNTITHVDAFKLHRIGYMVAGEDTYREDVYFMSGTTAIRIYFVIPSYEVNYKVSTTLRKVVNSIKRPVK